MATSTKMGLDEALQHARRDVEHAIEKVSAAARTVTEELAKQQADSWRSTTFVRAYLSDALEKLAELDAARASLNLICKIEAR